MRSTFPTLLLAGISLYAFAGCGPGEPGESATREATGPGGNGPTATETTPTKTPVRIKKFVSDSFQIDQKWGSMQGPTDVQRVALHETKEPEILWVTGYRASVIPADGKGTVSQDFMCHNNLDLVATEHAKFLEWGPGWGEHAAVRDRVFTISQGQFDLVLPDGFAIPLRSDEQLNLTTQVLNHNVEDPDVSVRHAIEITYSRDMELEEYPKPLLQHGIFVMASLDDTEAYFNVLDPNEEQEGSSCAVGEHANVNLGVFRDKFGRRFSGHWIVKPGREVRRTLVTEQLNLQYDTRIHFIGVHLHPFAESFELRDLTTGESLWTTKPLGPSDKIGLTEVDYYSSEDGIPIFMDHEYELVSVYDNTSGVDQDAMATMFLYLYDPEGAKAIESHRRLRRWASEQY